jgi:hypothetical protein
VSFVKRKHPNDKQKLVEAIFIKLLSLSTGQQPAQIKDTKEVARRVLE